MLSILGGTRNKAFPFRSIDKRKAPCGFFWSTIALEDTALYGRTCDSKGSCDSRFVPASEAIEGKNFSTLLLSKVLTSLSSRGGKGFAIFMLSRHDRIIDRDRGNNREEAGTIGRTIGGQQCAQQWW